MIIYQDNNEKIDFNLEIIPAIITLTLFYNNDEICFDLNGNINKNDNNYNINNINQWLENNENEINDIIWDWNNCEENNKKYNISPLIL